MEFDNLATIRQLAQLPPIQLPPPELKHSAWTAALRAVPAAAAEALAGGAELLTAGAKLGAGGGVAGFMQRGEPLSSITGETEISRSLRNVAESYGPDPATAGAAERLVFGLTRGIGKAVAYGVTTGPAAPFLFGADEGLTQMDVLQRQGVDTATAAKAGAVAAGVNAAGFLIPVAGKTAIQTAGLATVAGPASFIAQQASTREILRAADYGKVAEQFDPLDPAGLALSALPFGFGAWAMRARAKGGARPVAEPVSPAPGQRIEPTMVDTGTAAPAEPPAPHVPTLPQEAIDAAMVHNLTLAADHAEATLSHPMESLADYAARTLPKDAPAKKDGPDPFLGWLKQQGGVNFSDKFDITGEAGGVRLNRGGVFKSGGRGLDELAQIAEAEGWIPPGSTADVDGGVPALRDMIQRSMQGERILPLADQYQRIAQDHAAQARTLEAESLGARLQMLGVDPAPAMGNPDVLRAYLDQHEGRLLRQTLAEAQPPDLSVVHEPPHPRPAPPAVTQAQEAPPASAADAAPPVQQQATPAAAPAKPDPIAAMRARADQVAAEAPDMVIGHTPEGQPITARQELERIRQEAQTGTDTTLGAADAPLIDVAVQCALRLG